jgi:hypothetical protein
MEPFLGFLYILLVDRYIWLFQNPILETSLHNLWRLKSKWKT